MSCEKVKNLANKTFKEITSRNESKIEEKDAHRVKTQKPLSNSNSNEVNNMSKLSFSSKEIVYSINLKSKLEKKFENMLFSPTSIRMTSTPTSEFRNTIPSRNFQMKFYKAFNQFNVLEKKKFINLTELT